MRSLSTYCLLLSASTLAIFGRRIETGTREQQDDDRVRGEKHE